MYYYILIIKCVAAVVAPIPAWASSELVKSERGKKGGGKKHTLNNKSWKYISQNIETMYEMDQMTHHNTVYYMYIYK